MEYEAGHDEPTSVAVVVAVSSFEDRPMDSLPPLDRSVDPDALDDLFEVGDGEATDGYGELSFAFSDSLVTVDREGDVTVEPGSAIGTE